MEILAIALSGLLSLASSGGIILDEIAKKQINSQIISVEQQVVRIDNSPNYQLVRGKIDRVRIANRGVKIEPGLRIAVLDLETDAIVLKSQPDLSSIDELRASLAKPVSGAVKLIITEADLNRALQSPKILARLETILNQSLVSRAGATNIPYQLSNLRVNLYSANRWEIGFKLSRPRPSVNIEPDGILGTSTAKNRSRELNFALESTVEVRDGKTLRLIDPQGTVNNRLMSPRLLNGFAVGISDRLNLNSLERDGILARILQLEINQDRLELVGFVRVETKQK
jgi:hypothetical protein